MKNIRLIKQLTSQIQTVKADYEALKIQLSSIQKELNNKKNQVDNLQLEINKLNKNGELKVSEHAIIRYFERVSGLDIKILENEILCKEVKDLIEQFGGTGTFPHPKGYSLKVKDYTVITITK